MSSSFAQSTKSCSWHEIVSPQKKIMLGNCMIVLVVEPLNVSEKLALCNMWSPNLLTFQGALLGQLLLQG